MDTKTKTSSLQVESDVPVNVGETTTLAALSVGGNPYFMDANRAACKLFNLLRDGLPATAASADDHLRLEAVHAHAENEIKSLADGFSAIGTLVSLTGQVADDAGISGITLIRLGILIDHLAVTLDAVNELRSDAAFTLSQAARGAV